MDFRNPLGVVTPTLDGPILAALAVADASFTTGQLTRMLPHSDEGIRRVLRRLTEQGVVTAEVVGPVTAYRLNRDHLAFDPIQALAHSMGRLRERIEVAIAQWSIPPKYAAVFGSVARGTATASSDVDILIIEPKAHTATRWLEQIDELEASIVRWTGNDARVLVLRIDEVRDDQPVLQDVVREGLTVFGKPAWLRQSMKGHE